MSFWDFANAHANEVCGTAVAIAFCVFLTVRAWKGG